jgi:hypothetical protein
LVRASTAARWRVCFTPRWAINERQQAASAAWFSLVSLLSLCVIIGHNSYLTNQSYANKVDLSITNCYDWQAIGGNMRDLIPKIQEALQDRIILTVSERTGISKTTIFSLRDGKTTKRGPNIATIKTLANYLGIKP